MHDCDAWGSSAQASAVGLDGIVWILALWADGLPREDSRAPVGRSTKVSLRHVISMGVASQHLRARVTSDGIIPCS